MRLPIKNLQIYLFSLLSLATASCSVTRHLEPQQILVTEVSFEGEGIVDLKDGLKQNQRFRANRRILGLYPLYLQAWNYGLDGRDSNDLRTFFREKIGEEPSVLDTSKLENTREQLELYLFNNGYFNAEVSYKVSVRHSKAKVTYLIKLGQYYKVEEYALHIYDRTIYKLVLADSANWLVKEGKRFNTDVLSEERNRLENMLRNEGYYFFSKEFISFDVDSNQGNFSVAMALEIKNPATFKRHAQYRIDKVVVDVNYPYYLKGTDDSTFSKVNEVYVRTKGYPIHKEVLARYIKVKPGDLFSERDFRATYNGYLDLQAFSNVNLQMIPDTANHLLVMQVELIPDQRHQFTIEPQVITSDQSSAVQASNRRIWGLSGIVTYRNRNTFQGAERFDVRLGTSAEFQYINRQFTFSNLDLNLSNSLTIPKLWLINRWKWLADKAPEGGWRSPSTTYNLTFSYEYNQDYTQRTILLSYIYSFENRLHRFRIIPAEINLNQVNIRTDLLDRLGPGDRILLASLLNPNFIPSSRFEWLYNPYGRRKSRTGSFHMFRWNVLEWAGNLWYGGFKLSGAPVPQDGAYDVFGTNLFQFVKTEMDYRFYRRPQRDVNLAYRAHVGMALPIEGNSQVIPFDKRFFIGGANSLRGWRPRTVGPGSYNDQGATQIDRSGEVLIEGSTELRFKIFEGSSSGLYGALFVDAGNIWNVRRDTTLAGAEFRFDNFYNQIAINGGIGLRFDFSFFILRLDYGTQFRDPSYSKFNSWVFNDYNYLGRRTAFNFGIGYPF